MHASLKAIIVFLMCGAVSAAAAEGTGLAATYYDNMDFTGPSISRVDPAINFSWSQGTPAPGQIAPEYWSAVWVGSIEIPTTQTYTFTTLSDDGIVLMIDGTSVLENWTGHGPTEDSGAIALTKGRHSIEMRFYNSHGGATLKLYWQTQQMAKTIVPQAALYPTIPPAVVGTGTGLTGTYFSTGDWTGPSLQRMDPVIDFSWGTTAPMPGVRQEVFSVLWRGWIQPQYTQTYTFIADSDDGFGLWLDGQAIIDQLPYTPTGELTGKMHLVGGRRYEIVVKHRQMTGSAKAILSWSCPLTPRQVIPTSQLYPYDTTVAGSVAFTTAQETYSSPAWIAGVRGSSRSLLSASVNGTPVSVIPDASGTWFSAASPEQRIAPGVPLRPGLNQIAVSAELDGEQRTAQQTLDWKTLDLADLPYGLQSMIVRVGDHILATATGKGSVVEMTRTGADGSTTTWSGARGQAIDIEFPAAGQYVLSATVDGVAAGQLPVSVVGVDLRAPVACEVNYQRLKDVGVTAASGDVWFTGNDAGLIEVGQGAETATGRRLTIRPHGLGNLAVQARILDDKGPIIAWCPVQPFIQRTSAESTIGIIRELPDGSLLTQAVLTMRPLVSGLDVRLSMYTGGATFPDGTTLMWISSSQYTPAADGSGTYTYQIIRSPRAGSGLCHTTQTYQAGVLVGNH